MVNIAVGCITFNNDNKELSVFASMLNSSLRHIDADVTLMSIDNGLPINWPAVNCKHLTLKSLGNIGFAAGVNVLLNAAFDTSSEAIIVANPDGGFHPMCLHYLIEVHRARSPSLLEARQFPEEHPKHYDAKALTTGWAAGACLLIPRQIYQTVGPLDENFFMYFEDVDYSWRARAAGYSVYLVPRALYYHDVIGRKMDLAKHRSLLISQRYLAHKWGCSSHVELVERELVSLKLYKAKEDIPPLPAIPSFSYRDQLISDFTLPRLGPGRW